MEEDCVGDRYMIFAEDAIWKTYVYIAFLAEKLHYFFSRGWILGISMQQTGRDF